MKWVTPNLGVRAMGAAFIEVAGQVHESRAGKLSGDSRPSLVGLVCGISVGLCSIPFASCSVPVHVSSSQNFQHSQAFLAQPTTLTW
jgi:hypothetical protein